MTTIITPKIVQQSFFHLQYNIFLNKLNQRYCLHIYVGISTVLSLLIVFSGSHFTLKVCKPLQY